MPAYKYTTKAGKQLWYANFYYVDWKGNRLHKCKRGFATRKEAQEWERDFISKGASDPTIPFSSLLEKYMEDMRSRLKPTTIQNKDHIYKTKLLPFFGDMRICDITPLTVRRWQNEQIEYRDENGKPYAKTYLKSLHVQLSCLMNYAVKYYGLDKNPCHATGGMGKSDAEEMHIWSRDQFEEFIQYEKKSTFRAAFDTLFYTGMREGELLALTPEDVPWDKMLIHVTKTLAVIDGKEVFLTPKTEQSIRDIQIHPKLHEELLAYLDSMAIEPDDRMFYFTKSGLLKEFHRVTDKACMDRIRIHDLRHSHASMLIQMGVPIPEISKRLGHKSPNTTLRIYSHLIPGQERNIADMLHQMSEGSRM